MDKKKLTSKIFNDPIHGHLELPKECIAVIDTKQFQRLRFIKQMGFICYVYPGATHTRFEHSIGTCYLAGEFIKILRQTHDEIEITDNDAMCVQLAALCHDLGHGPFSHVFDDDFLPSLDDPHNIKHEKLSEKMFDYMIEDNKLLKKGLEKCQPEDIEFIKTLINPPGDLYDTFSEVKEKTGRGQDKAFLYEIVSNKATGVDVDKWDYFARDCYHLRKESDFNHLRFMKFVRILEVPMRNGGKAHRLCVRDKELRSLCVLYQVRYQIHREACFHKVKCAIDIMFVDALKKANERPQIEKEDGSKLKISECITDMSAYTKLTDDILLKMNDTIDDNESSKVSKELVERILTRDIYRCLHETAIKDDMLQRLAIRGIFEVTEEAVTKEFLKVFKQNEQYEKIKMGKYSISKDKPVEVGWILDNEPGCIFRIKIVKINFGKKDQNPLSDVWCYKKQDVTKPYPADKDQMGLLKPSTFEETFLRVYRCLRSSKDDQERSLADQITQIIRESISTLLCPEDCQTVSRSPHSVDSSSQPSSKRARLTKRRSATSSTSNENTVSRSPHSVDSSSQPLSKRARLTKRRSATSSTSNENV